MEIFFYISATILIFYVIIISSFAIGWHLIKQHKQKAFLDHPHVSIVIACRNEEENISALLDSIAKQKYPKDKTEIILIDDHSDDETINMIQSKSDQSIQLLHLPKGITGKKAALQYGINLAQSEIIITTDADCTMNEKWISELVSYYLLHKPKLLVAPVIFKPQQNLFQKLQSLEFLSLIASGAGAIGIKRPIMCNGANLLFEKSIYTNAFHVNNYASGDDIFLLLFTKTKYRNDIHFIKSADAIVYTRLATTIQEFFAQRIRWTSKSKAYRDLDIIFTAVMVALTNFILVCGLLASVFDKKFLLYYILLLISKSIIDLILLVPASRFFGQQKLIWLFLPLQIIYPIYIVFTAFAGLVGKFEWKKRSFG